MAAALNEQENLEQQLAHNSARMKELVEQQYNVEVTRSLQLCFSAASEECARALNKTLFAKGTRTLTRDPEAKGDGRFHLKVGVKRSLRDAVRDEFVHDLVHTAAGMNGTYDGWTLLTEDAAEQTQPHDDAPDTASAPVANNPQNA